VIVVDAPRYRRLTSDASRRGEQEMTDRDASARPATVSRGAVGGIARSLMRAVRAPVTFTIKQEALKPALDSLVETLASRRCPQHVEGYENYVFDLETDFVDRDGGVATARKALEQNGIIVIKNFFSPQEVRRLGNDIAALIDSLESDIRGLREYETEKFILTHRGGRLQDKTASEKPFVWIRRDDGSTAIDHDEGVIEVTKTLELFPAHRAIDEKVSGTLLRDITGQTLSAGRTLVNRSVARTRGFHVDAKPTDRMVFDGILYLTDVRSMADGPYCFVRGTQNNWPLRQINHFVNTKLRYGPENDLHLFSRKRVAPVLGQAGTMLISTPTHGIHRGYPQEPGHSRMALFFS
jgi:hypothetical protein